MTAAAIGVREVLADVPHDGTAIFLYLFLAACLVLVWRAGRSRSAPPEAGPTESPNRSRERSR